MEPPLTTRAVIACNGPVLALGVEDIVRDAGGKIVRVNAGGHLADVLTARDASLLIVDDEFTGRERAGVTVIVCSSEEGTMRVLSPVQGSERVVPMSRGDLLAAIGLPSAQSPR
jgi:hypothetical protein